MRYLAILYVDTNVVIAQIPIPDSITDDQVIAMDNELQKIPSDHGIEICVTEDAT